MTGDEYRKVIDFENGLQVGSLVLICWTNCGRHYAANATVCKVNAKSIVATLDDAVATDTDLGGYPKGQKIRSPRLAAIKLWSVNNRVEPRGGYQ